MPPADLPPPAFGWVASEGTRLLLSKASLAAKRAFGSLLCCAVHLTLQLSATAPHALGPLIVPHAHRTVTMPRTRSSIARAAPSPTNCPLTS